jgi:hypothetical protein
MAVPVPAAINSANPADSRMRRAKLIPDPPDGACPRSACPEQRRSY